MRLVVTGDGFLTANGVRHRCVVGRGGLARVKKEGDGATPIGRYPLRKVLYRPDRLPTPPKSGLPIEPISRDDGWCDDPRDPKYNRPVKLPYVGKAERMWRNDGLYDLLAVIGYNDSPPEPLRGSAIFLHVATPDLEPTEGCVALLLADLQEVIAGLTPGSEIDIRAAED